MLDNLMPYNNNRYDELREICHLVCRRRRLCKFSADRKSPAPTKARLRELVLHSLNISFLFGQAFGQFAATPSVN